MHAHSSHLLVYSCWIINFWASWCDSNTHTHSHTHRRCLETGSIPLSVLLKEALTSFLASGQTHSYPSQREREGERGETEGGIETGTGGGRERKKDWHHLLPGHKVACSFGMCVRLCYTYAAPPSEGEWVRDKIGSETTLSGKQDHRLVFPLQPLTSTPWTFSFMWSSRVVLPSFLFFQQYPSFLYFTFLRL